VDGKGKQVEIIKCKSCGAPLKFATCGHCGAFHHGESKMKHFIAPADITNDEIEKVTGMYEVSYGVTVMRPELIAKIIRR